MTLEELKSEAKAQGYKLIKDNPMPKLLPCVCGGKRREMWHKYDMKTSEHYVCYRCQKCGKESEFARNERKAREAWNKMVLEEQPNG